MVIMASVITVSAVTLQRFSQNNHKAADLVALIAVKELIKNNIKHQLIVSNETGGEGVFNEVSYKWQAETVAFKAPPPRFQEGGSQSYQPRYRLLNINLSLQHNGTTHQVEYRELTWAPDLFLTVQ
nr:hypothetical protein [Alishewanella longhuensis]